MITLPDFRKAFDYENQFYLSCSGGRMGKAIAHYELYKMATEISGDIIECGIFKGASFCRFAMIREIFGDTHKKRLVGFDTFGRFPETSFAGDAKMRSRFMRTAGAQSISRSQLQKVLNNKNLYHQVELIAGNIENTVPAYLKKNPRVKISLLNLDTDIYEPAVVILENLYPRLSRGGILILDDYGVFEGETRAVDNYFNGKKIKIRHFSYSKTPAYIVKD